MARRIVTVVRPLAFGLLLVLAVSTAIIGVIQFFRFTTISTQDRKTGAVKRETFFGKSPLPGSRQ